MTTPLNQGTLNRLRASLVYADNPNLNVTAPFLTTEGISMAFEGVAGSKIPTMTGGVNSPEPYQMVTVTAHINRAMNLANLYKQQFEQDVQVGSVNVINDATTLENYELEECILQGVSEITADGKNAGFTVRLQGIYYINRAMWDAS